MTATSGKFVAIAARGKSLNYWLVVTAVLCAAWAALVIFRLWLIAFDYGNDDAYLSLTYAKHLSLGEGLVFDRRERIWGFTSPLFTLAIGGMMALGLDGERSAIILSVLCMAMACFILSHLASAVSRRYFMPLLALWLLTYEADYLNFAMESGLLLALQAGFLAAIHYGRFDAAALLGSMSCLCRPDSLMLAVPGMLLCSELRRPRRIAIFCLPGICWLAFAYFYFGALLPNSFWAKRGTSGWQEYLNGILGITFHFRFMPSDFVLQPIWLLASLAVVMAALPAYLGRGTIRRPHAYAVSVYPLVTLTAYIAIAPPFEHVWETFSPRFFLHYGLAWGALFGATIACEKVLGTRRSLPFCLSLLIAVPFTQAARDLPRAVDLVEAQKNIVSLGCRRRVYFRAIKSLKKHARPGEDFGAYEPGMFGYFTDLNVVDLVGLVSRRGQTPSIIMLEEGNGKKLNGREYRRIKQIKPECYSSQVLLRRIERTRPHRGRES